LTMSGEVTRDFEQEIKSLEFSYCQRREKKCLQQPNHLSVWAALDFPWKVLPWGHRHGGNLGSPWELGWAARHIETF
jgi:hypothetical protein